MEVMNKGEMNKSTGSGRFIMAYGETGAGKTTSILATAPDPILYIAAEPRSLQPSLEAAERDDLDIDITYYTNWDELMEFVNTSKNTDRYATIVVDGYTYLMGVDLSIEIENEAFDARTKGDKSVEAKPLVMRTKMSLEGYGGLSSQMTRLHNALAKLSQNGKVVIVTALLSENPKWNRELSAAPALKGKEFPTSMPAALDLIGLVQARTDDNGKLVYPPNIFFESPDGSFMCKFSGKRAKGKAVMGGVLNFKKILGIK